MSRCECFGMNSLAIDLVRYELSCNRSRSISNLAVSISPISSRVISKRVDRYTAVVHARWLVVSKGNARASSGSLVCRAGGTLKRFPSVHTSGCLRGWRVERFSKVRPNGNGSLYRCQALRSRISPPRRVALRASTQCFTI